MAFPTITTAPTAPTRSMSNDEFIEAADAFVAWMATLDDQINAWSTYAAAFGASLGVSSADAELLALAGLTSAANTLPYFTGSGTASLADLTAFARTLLDDADASTARGTLGLGTIATQAASSVAITGGSVSGITDLAVADGGTGASTATAARANLGIVDSAFLPSGMVAPFAMNAAPTGWLECDGSAVSRTTYASLFTAVGTTHGSGDGSTTFNLPDLRGEFIRGWDHGRGIDSGRSFGSSQADDFEAHTHTFSVKTSDTEGGAFADATTTSTGSGTVTTDSTGGAETRPRNIALLYAVKT
jgi:microcystin-dependent protein